MIGRFAGTLVVPPSPFVATAVLVNEGMKAPTGLLSARRPSSISARIATLVSALVCDAMRKIVSDDMRLPASLSAHPNARS